MTITATQLREIRQEFAKLKPASITLDGNHAMTVKQAIFILASTCGRQQGCAADSGRPATGKAR